MTRISSKSTFFQKRIVPVVWFGCVAVFSTFAILAGGLRAALLALIPLCAITAVGYFVFKTRIWGLVDEVLDCGDTLLVRNRGAEERIPLTNIKNVTASALVNPRRVALQLIRPGKFGAEIAFIPVSGLLDNPFAKNPVAEDLAARVTSAHQPFRNFMPGSG